MSTLGTRLCWVRVFFDEKHQAMTEPEPLPNTDLYSENVIKRKCTKTVHILASKTTPKCTMKTK